MRMCGKPGCPNLVPKGYCAQHQKSTPRAQSEAVRLTAAQRGYNYRWQKASAARLEMYPLCEVKDCPDRDIPHAADVTDHIIPHKGDPVLFWDPNNWQSACERSHNIKTAREDGGFGRPQGGSKSSGLAAPRPSV